jgi:hypothetical protein
MQIRGPSADVFPATAGILRVLDEAGGLQSANQFTPRHWSRTYR